MTKKMLFELDDIPEAGGRAFRFKTPGGDKDAFVVRYSGEVRAYINSCPHTGVKLNWSDDQFFDVDHKFIQCSMHGALFEPLDGRCVWGPCLGESLQSVPFELVDQQVIIYI